MFKSTSTYVQVLVVAIITALVDQGEAIRCYSCGSNVENSDCFQHTTSIEAVECPEDLPFCSYTENREPWIYPNDTRKSPFVQVILGCSRTMRKQNCLEGKYCTWKTCYQDLCNCYSPDCTNGAMKPGNQASRHLVVVATITAILWTTFQNIGGAALNVT